MKKSLLTLAALGTFAGTAAAQPSVTVYGKLDLGVGQNIGSSTKAVQESAPANNRIGFRGVEDLGGGLSALFGIEHRFRPDTGAEGVAGRFWHGFSTVGLRGPWGTVNLGRQYTPAFSLIQNQLDPFAGVTVANMRDVGTRPGAAVQGLSGTLSGVAAVSKVRISDSIRYDFSGAGVNFAASVAESNQEAGTTAGPDRPWSVAANYSSGALFVGAGYEDPQGANDHQWNVGARYGFKGATVSAGLASGRTDNNLKVRGWLLGLNYPIGHAELKAGYARSEIGSGPMGVEFNRLGVGYHYNLSKNTKIFTDIAHESEIAAHKTGFDLGIEHNF
jgi:predicted porin